MTIRTEVRRELARRLHAPDIDVSLEHLAKRITPNLIFDVGAYRGEFAQRCLKLWPGARVVCFEPLEHAVHDLYDLSRSGIGRIDVHRGLLGADEHEAVAFHEMETASSVLAEWAHQDPATHQRMTTLDAVVRDGYRGQAPHLLKIDTQGYELEVLKGAEASLPGMWAVIAELNLLDIHKDVPLIAEVMQWLHERDFVAYDICELHRRPLDDAL
ncbi:MAG: FkbM family methyltransferase, partial [Burkholderiales bacterium]